MMERMLKGALLCAAAALCCLSVGAAALNEIYVDFAVKTDVEPVLDGKLDDPVWQKAVVHDRFYEYFKPRPNVSPLKSEMRLLYPDKALWIGLTHFEEHPENNKGFIKFAAVVGDKLYVNRQKDKDEICLLENGTLTVNYSGETPAPMPDLPFDSDAYSPIQPWEAYIRDVTRIAVIGKVTRIGYRIEGDRMYIYDSIGICAMMRIGGADR